MIRYFVIFGASGDLTSRYLLPTLAQLHQARMLPLDLRVTGIAPEAWGPAYFRKYVRLKLDQYAAQVPIESREALIASLDYRRADVTKPEEVKAAIASVKEPAVLYLALPPRVLSSAAQSIVAAGVLPGSRIVVEKPFGVDFGSTRRLNRLLHSAFPEQSIFRMDHFLGKQTVQNILGLRFGNRVFEPVWNCQHIERIEITWDETLTVEGRVGFYDSTGALRDMLQNHLLQLLCLAGMEAPPSFDEQDLRGYKVAFLRAVRRLLPDEIRRCTIRGRYSAGRIGSREVPAYVDEAGVDPTRGTETFAQVTLSVDNWRWAGVPFSLRSGKALGRDRMEIAIHFKPVPHLAFPQQAEPRMNVLRLELNPDRMALGVNINGPGDPFNLEYVELDTALAPQEISAYGRLLLDLLRGDLTLSIRDDEAEESWRIVEPILEAWRKGDVPLLEYPAGSDGPAVS
ncbi:MAG: glucose-6-phosphate dehydrogenase [Deltaproteobacteria bacterium]|nr:glucose-6-phosphate dehydrogenase [Deltaproteobacteria bacterium]